MQDWVAIEATTDRRTRATELARAHDHMASGERRRAGDAPVRDVIQRSWQRSTAAGIDPGHGMAPVRLGADEAASRWENHPLAIAVPILRGLLDDVGDQDHVALVCDADGALLWLDGRPSLIEAAREVNLEVGSVWSEAAAGTNAMGTALAEHHAVQVFSAEHYSTTVHPWTCSAAPVHDPATGALLGVIDLTGDLSTAHPHSLAVVAMAARTIEQQLLLRMQTAPSAAQETSSGISIPRSLGRATASLTVLGRERGELAIDGETLTLSPRHTELLLLLWLVREGLSAEQLALELYGEQGRPGSVRTELHRLRAKLGSLVGERPYRLLGPMTVDVDAIDRKIRQGDVRGALADYPGPLLAHTEVPRLVEQRDRIDDELRAAVLASGETALIEGWLQTPSGRDDYEASQRLITSLEREDPRRAAERSRQRRLAEERRRS